MEEVSGAQCGWYPGSAETLPAVAIVIPENVWQQCSRSRHQFHSDASGTRCLLASGHGCTASPEPPLSLCIINSANASIAATIPALYGPCDPARHSVYITSQCQTLSQSLISAQLFTWIYCRPAGHHGKEQR